jgi:hypothetical protein
MSRTPSVAAALDDLLERRDQRLAAIEAEALGAGELDVEELLEAFGLDQLVEDRLLALGGELDLLVRALDPLLHPGLLGSGSEMCMNSTPMVGNRSGCRIAASRGSSRIRGPRRCR